MSFNPEQPFPGEIVFIEGTGPGKSESHDRITNAAVEYHGDMTAPIEVGRKWVDRFASRGCVCPACGNYVRIWRRSMISTNAADLIRLVRLYDGRPLHVREFSQQRNGNFAALVYWGLILPSESTDEKKRRSGYWRPTPRGKEWARGEMKVPRYILTRDGHLHGYEGPFINVVEALGRRFDYQELLRGEA